MKYDLHVHTSFSDGLLSPADVVDMAIDKGLNGIAITDHDTILGIDQAINQGNKYKDIDIIPGIEFGCIFSNEEVHILGYFIDHTDFQLNQIIRKLRSSRIDRAIKIIEKLKELGISISLLDVKTYSTEDNIGRPHIARTMVDNKYVENIKEAFDKYLNRGKPAYVERYQLSIIETISLIKSIKGLSVLAHPGLLKDTSIIEYCIANGINGIECIHSKHTSENVKLFTDLANKNNLIITGGSDFHGNSTNFGDFYVDFESIKVMKERIPNV